MGGCEGGMREGRERLFVFLVSIRKRDGRRGIPHLSC